MFIFAHVGITMGAATLVSGVIAKCHTLRRRLPDPPHIVSINTSPEAKKSFSEIIGLKSLSRFLDIRLLMIGSLFPDIIDKPLEFIGFSNGRSITHTLLVTLIFLFTGLFLSVNYKKTWLMAIAIGMSTHLILDSMWLTPHTLLWPMYGWSFPSLDHRIGLAQISLWWSTLTSNVTVDITEGIGAAILLGIAWILVGPRKLKLFIAKGKI
jgi:inner membrane protein